MLFMALGGLLSIAGLLAFFRRLRQATYFLSRNRRAFRFCVLDNDALNTQTKANFKQWYRHSEPTRWQLVFSLKRLKIESWYDETERQWYFVRYIEH